jgi:hypothetical protein
MTSLPDVPGKSLISGMTKRTRMLAGAAGAGALAVGGTVAKRVLGHGGDEAASADPIAETPTAPPGAEEKPVPKPQPVKPKAAPGPKAEPKPEADKPKAPPKPEAAKPKPAKPKAAPKPKADKPKAAPKPKAAKGKPAPKEKPAKSKGPHAALNNPVVDDPDLTEYPDPYDTREDPLDELHPQTGAESTSEPPLQQDPEVENGGKPPRRDKLDD